MVLDKNVAHLPDIRPLHVTIMARQYDHLPNIRVHENVVASARSHFKAEVLKHVAERLKVDVGVGLAGQEGEAQLFVLVHDYMMAQPAVMTE